MYNGLIFTLQHITKGIYFILFYWRETSALGLMAITVIYSHWLRVQAERMKVESLLILDKMKTLHCVRDIREANLEDLLVDSDDDLSDERNFVVTLVKYRKDKDSKVKLRGLEILKQEVSLGG